MSVRIHSTANVEDGCLIGEGTSIWDHVHVRFGTQIGEQCIVGGKTYIAYDVRIGNRCKINSAVYICNGVTLEDGVMISAGTIFTNDRFPRAATPDLAHLRPSEPDEFTDKTIVCAGATIGAGCIIGSNLEIGRWAMVGMGSIVTKSVPAHHVVLGTPARSVGAVCRCGQLLCMFSEDDLEIETLVCSVCNDNYSRVGQHIEQVKSQHDGNGT